MASAPADDPDSRPAFWRTLAMAIAAVALGLLFFTTTAPSAADALDPSWKAVLGHDVLEGRQFGRETVFTCGPLTYFLTDHPPYIPSLFSAAIVIRLLLGLVAAAILVAAGRAVHPWPMKVVGIAALLVVLPCQREIVHFAALALLPMAVGAARRPALGWLAAAGLYAVAIALTKQNLLFAAAIVLPCTLLIVARARGFAFAALIAGVVAAELIVVWAVIRQDPRNLPAYFVSAIEATLGYADAMAVPQPPERRLFTLGTGLSLAIAGCAGLVARARARRDLAGAVATLAILAVGAISTKLGLVRADDGHRSVTNGVLMIVGVALASGGSRLADVFRGLTVGCAAVGLFLATAAFGYSAARVPVMVEGHVTQAMDELLHPDETRTRLDAIRHELAFRNALPTLAAAIGSEPVDLIGASQGVLYLAGMNVRHRPVFQDYFVFAPGLNARNAAFFARSDAPRFVLMRLWGIDGRHPTVSDSGSLRALMLRYQPMSSERGYALFERQERPAAAGPVAIRTRRVAFGETLDLYDLSEGLVELSLDVEPTFSGHLEALLERPPFLWIAVTLASGTERRYRISQSLTVTPFILSPFVDSTASFVDLWGHRARERVTAVRFEVEEGRSGSVHPDVGVTLWSDPVAWDRLLAPQTGAARLMQFPTFKTPPDSVSPADQVWALDEPGASGVMAHAPATLTWKLAAGSWRARGRYGMLRRAWEEGTTDGVVVVAEVASDGAAPREILRRDLAPRAQPADREPVAFDLAFELEHPGRLVLRTDPGAARNAEWDWAWWSDLAVERAK